MTQTKWSMNPLDKIESAVDSFLENNIDVKTYHVELDVNKEQEHYEITFEVGIRKIEKDVAYAMPKEIFESKYNWRCTWDCDSVSWSHLPSNVQEEALDELSFWLHRDGIENAGDITIIFP
jgi:hypothetical protein